MKPNSVTPTQPSMSPDFLKTFISKRITGLVRYSWWPAEEVAFHCDSSNEFAFSLTAGPLAIIFEEGLILGIASDPALNSVVVWDEGERRRSSSSLALDKDDELFPISADEQPYATPFWRQLIGLPLNRLSILKKKSMSARESERPSELGLRFQVAHEICFIASHGLHDGSDDFSVLEEFQLASVDLEEFQLN